MSYLIKYIDYTYYYKLCKCLGHVEKQAKNNNRQRLYISAAYFRWVKLNMFQLYWERTETGI